MARPKHNQKFLIAFRNTLIIHALEKLKLSQSDTAFIFRLPRNTISTINKKHNEEK